MLWYFKLSKTLKKRAGDEGALSVLVGAVWTADFCPIKINPAHN